MLKISDEYNNCTPYCKIHINVGFKSHYIIMCQSNVSCGAPNNPR